MKQRPIILSAATPDILPYCQELIANKQEYADQWGFDFKCMTSHFAKSHHPAFSKVPFLFAYLKHYDHVMWVDMDACFTNFNIDIRTRLPNCDIVTGAAQVEPPVYCTGVMSWKKSPQTILFMKKWLFAIRNLSRDTHPWEQWHLNALTHPANENYFNWKCPKIALADLDKFFYSPDNKWEPGDFICHINPWLVDGVWEDVWPKRRKLFLEISDKMRVIKCK